MFANEDELQALLNDNPEVLADTFMEMSTRLHKSSVPRLISLGREISLSSGSLDNLFIDAQGILTIVECKLYHNPGIKREVYSQTINYAADIQAHLRIHSGVDNDRVFQDAFTELLLVESPYDDFNALIADLRADPFLERYKKAEWEDQFKIRLRKNIELGIFRIVIACGPHINQDFHIGYMLNLMKIMQFSEHGSSVYDLSLIDVRKASEGYESKITWRRYSELPQLPLIHQSSRNSAKIHDLHSQIPGWPQSEQDRYQALRNLLNQNKIELKPTTQGFSLYYQDRSLYIELLLSSHGIIKIRRVQIEPLGSLWKAIELEDFSSQFAPLSVETQKVKSTTSIQGFKYHIILRVEACFSAEQLFEAIIQLNDSLT